MKISKYEFLSVAIWRNNYFPLTQPIYVENWINWGKLYKEDLYAMNGSFRQNWIFTIYTISNKKYLCEYLIFRTGFWNYSKQYWCKKHLFNINKNSKCVRYRNSHVKIHASLLPRLIFGDHDLKTPLKYVFTHVLAFLAT